MAEALLKTAPAPLQPEEAGPDFRVGLGQDSHRFAKTDVAKPLLLGGVKFDNEPALEAESDGDVILHAVFNALSQAVGGRSLGHYADPLCREQGITDSRRYLEIALQMTREKRYLIANVGVSIECRRPRIEPRAIEIKRNLAQLLGIAEGQVSITATSGEGLTAFGRGEGIQALAIAALARDKAA
jgi:2-C-methyl-D-erythritol 2,4-cyclodiphosphate synthase